MLELLVFLLFVVLVLAVVNHYFFPIPPFAWGILAIIVLFILAAALLGDANLNLGHR